MIQVRQMTNDQLDEVNLQLEKQKQELAHAEKISEVSLCLSLCLSVSLSLGGRCCCQQDVDGWMVGAASSLERRERGGKS